MDDLLCEARRLAPLKPQLKPQLKPLAQVQNRSFFFCSTKPSTTLKLYHTSYVYIGAWLEIIPTDRPTYRPPCLQYDNVTVFVFSCAPPSVRFSSNLPGGSTAGRRSGTKGGAYCILDCVFHELDQTFFVLDMMAWKVGTVSYG